MNKLNFSIVINAPKEEVWDSMLGEETYRIWTEPFAKGSHFVGEWSEGSKIYFLGPDPEGNMSGMLSRIKEIREYEYVSIEHIGFVNNGIEDTSSDAVKDWAGAMENYSFKENDGNTEVVVELIGNIRDEYSEMFKDMWPKALNKLKEIAEN
ncbi:MAG: SRPBCC domain-containing protein [Melioribacteraceae bacterium]|nr:SRPBCC domain-containing protein [Melioribacteraceae bacterium]